MNENLFVQFGHGQPQTLMNYQLLSQSSSKRFVDVLIAVPHVNL